MARRAAAVGGGVLVLILLVLGVRGCLDARKERAFKDYVRDVGALVQQSDQQGEALFGLLRTPGDQTAVDLQNTVNGFRAEADQLVDRAQDTDRPGELKSAHRYLLEALEFRRDGLAGIARELPTALGDEGRSEATRAIAAQMLNFLTSDVVYSQRAIPRIQGPLEKEGLADEAAVPKSQFLPDIDWLRPNVVADRISRIRGGAGDEQQAAAPGLHGNGLGTVTALPAGRVLSESAAVDIPVSEDLQLRIQVQNQGENTEQDVTVKVTINGAGRDITIQDQLDTIAAGETKDVTIPVAETPPTGRPVTIEVEIEAVPGEEKTDNNARSFRAVFVS